MAKFDADASGFLVGQPLGDAQAVKLLGGIKSDTRRILEAMRNLGASARRGPSGARAPIGSSSSYMAAVSPGGRAVATARAVARDPTTGRFVTAARGAPPTPTEQRMTRSAQVAARAAEVVAAVTEANRRDDKTKGTTQARGADGRFGAGGRRGGGDASGFGGGDGVASSLANAGSAAISGAEQLDPLVRAANEFKGLASDFKGVASPVWGAAKGIFGRFRRAPADKEQAEQTGWLKKIWKALRGKGSGEGGGFFQSLTSIIPAVLATLGGAATTALAAIASSALPILARTFPALGAFLAGAGGFALGDKIAGRMKAQRAADEKDRDANLSTYHADYASEMEGVDPNLVRKMIGAETGGSADPFNAKSGTSSAFGVGQITDDTWKRSVRQRAGTQNGGVGYLSGDSSKLTDAEIMALRGDKGLQAAMAAYLVHDAEGRARAFARKTKTPYEDAQTRAMYVLGAPDGGKFLDAYTSNPSALASSVLSAEAVKANGELLSGSVGDVMARFRSQMGGSRKIAALANPFRSAIQQSPPLSPMGRISPPSMIPAIGAMPALDAAGMSGLGKPSPAPVVRVDATPLLTQDVRDRDIAHIATGGIGQGPRR